MARGAFKSGIPDKAMAQPQAGRIDNGAWYQAVRVREDMATYEFANLQRLERSTPNGAERTRLAGEISAQNAEITHVRARKGEVQSMARRAENDLTSMQAFGHQYDLAYA